MLRRLLPIILLLIIAYGLWNLVKSKVGDIRPSVLPPAKTAPTSVSSDSLPLDMSNLEVFSDNLGSPRDLVFSPGGKLLVSIPSQGKILALPEKKEVVGGLNKPHGIAFYNFKLYIAEETRISRYNWNEESSIATLDKVLFELPRGGSHVTRSLAFSSNGQMFVSIGSTCNVCIEKHPSLASVIVSDSEGTSPRLYANGLRNAVFITVKSDTRELWGTEMGRDLLGDDLPADEINIIKDGKDYGWPNCYEEKVRDNKFQGGSEVNCEATEAPIYKIAAHSAPLGLAFQGKHLYVAYHGSWNRSTPIGYKVVRFDVNGITLSNEQDFITGFIEGSEAAGRPVDIDFDKEGNMFLSDDKRGVVYKLSASNFSK